MIGKNNPFNIRYNRFNRWIGLEGETKGFCDFDSLEHGVRVGAYLVCKSYRSKGICTIRAIINRFAPPSENHTLRYITFVSNNCNLKPGEVLDKHDYVQVLHNMALYETNFYVSVSYLHFVITKYNLF